MFVTPHSYRPGQADFPATLLYVLMRSRVINLGTLQARSSVPVTLEGSNQHANYNVLPQTEMSIQESKPQKPRFYQTNACFAYTLGYW